MANYETPEILRLPLEELCLRIKVCGLGAIRDVLGAALDPPTQKMIDNAILTLQEVRKTKKLLINGVTNFKLAYVRYKHYQLMVMSHLHHWALIYLIYQSMCILVR
jgi:hypothetical protein